MLEAAKDTYDLSSAAATALLASFVYAIHNLSALKPRHVALQLRTIWKDDTDSNSTTFLDSDGSANNNLGRPAPFPNATDSQWHHVVLTSLPSNASGYQVYLDGALVAQQPLLSDQGIIEVTGGNPIVLSQAPIMLCSRSDGAPDRHLTGSVTHLTIYNEAVGPSGVRSLYAAVPLPAAAPAPGPVSSPVVHSLQNVASEQQQATLCFLGDSVPGVSACSSGSCIPVPTDALFGNLKLAGEHPLSYQLPSSCSAWNNIAQHPALATLLW